MRIQRSGSYTSVKPIAAREATTARYEFHLDKDRPSLAVPVHAVQHQAVQVDG